MSKHRLSPRDVLEIFHELPQHRGCSSAELDAAERELGVTLPRFYRDIMLLDAHRLCDTEIFIPITQLCEWTRTAPADFRSDCIYTLGLNDVIFATFPGAEDNYFFEPTELTIRQSSV